MIYRNPEQRVVVLVDVQNLYYSAKNLFGARINFKNLLTLVVKDRVLVRAIAYVIQTETEAKDAFDAKENEFFDAVNTAGFEIKEKDLQIFAGGAKKGDWDLGIAMDAIRLGQKVDSIVLVSGDGDFIPVVNYLQQSLGCLVEVVAFKQTTNRGLAEIADDFIDIEKHAADLLFRTQNSIATMPRPQGSAPRGTSSRTGSMRGTSSRPTSIRTAVTQGTNPMKPRMNVRAKPSDKFLGVTG